MLNCLAAWDLSQLQAWRIFIRFRKYGFVRLSAYSGASVPLQSVPMTNVLRFPMTCILNDLHSQRRKVPAKYQSLEATGYGYPHTYPSLRRKKMKMKRNVYIYMCVWQVPKYILCIYICVYMYIDSI